MYAEARNSRVSERAAGERDTPVGASISCALLQCGESLGDLEERRLGVRDVKIG